MLGPLLCPGRERGRGLLEDWGSDARARVWTFRLRPGLAFHNGREATADDLVFTLSHILACPFETPDKTLLRNVAAGGLAAADRLTATVTLKEPEPSFDLLIKDSFFSLVPREELRPSGSGLRGPSPNSGSHLSWKRHPVGAGPYRIVRTSEGGAAVELEAFKALPKAAPNRLVLTTGRCGAKADLALGYSTNPRPGLLDKTVVDTPFALMGFNSTSPTRWPGVPGSARRTAAPWTSGPSAPRPRFLRPARSVIPSNFWRRLSRKPAFHAVRPALGARLYRRVLGAGPIAPVRIPVGEAGGGRPPAWLSRKRGGSWRGPAFPSAGSPVPAGRPSSWRAHPGGLRPAPALQLVPRRDWLVSRLDAPDSRYAGLLAAAGWA